MKKFTFFLFALALLTVFTLVPEDLINKRLLSLETINSTNIPFLNTIKEQTPEEAYSDIYDALINLSDQIYLSTKLTSNQVFDIREAVIRDNPDIFYLDYENSTYWSNGKLEFKYTDTKENIIAQRDMIDRKTNYIISKIISPSMTEFEKELAIHDYIVLNTEYDVKNYNNNTIPPSSFNIYGILIDGIGVCEGYAQTFKLLLDKVGIESIVVAGPKINHAWNMVKLDGKYYHVDVTWNDPVPDRRGRVSHRYFNVSDRKMIQGEHIWDQEKYPKCNSEDYSRMWSK